jgi:hypothetical protein
VINSVHARRVTTVTDEEAVEVLQWLGKVGDGDAPDVSNGRIVEVLIRKMSEAHERERPA